MTSAPFTNVNELACSVHWCTDYMIKVFVSCMHNPHIQDCSNYLKPYFITVSSILAWQTVPPHPFLQISCRHLTAVLQCSLSSAGCLLMRACTFCNLDFYSNRQHHQAKELSVLRFIHAQLLISLLSSLHTVLAVWVEYVQDFLKDDMQRFFTKLMQKSFLAAYCNINPSV